MRLWEQRARRMPGRVLVVGAVLCAISANVLASPHLSNTIGRELQQPAPQASVAKQVGVIKNIAGNTVTLTTDAGTRAERFYRAAGWKIVGTSTRGELPPP